MTAQPVLIRKISQKDNYTFTIEWSDGKQHHYRLSELQRRCSCANCMDEVTGKKLIDDKSIREDVRATKIVNVGRYALRIQYTMGCSTGIYTFNMLRAFGDADLENKK